MAALTDQEKAKILRHSGYPDWSSLALAWGVSFPTAIEPQYFLRDAFNRISDAGLELVRMDLQQCDEIERQLIDARKRLKALRVGDITLNPEEIPVLEGQLEKWKVRLLNDFGAQFNPYRQQAGSSRNGTVTG